MSTKSLSNRSSFHQDGETALFYATRNCDDDLKEVLRYLLKKGISINSVAKVEF